MKRFLLVALCTVLTVCAFAKEKTPYRNAVILAYSPANSVYEDDNIKLEIYDESLWITNKSSKTVFIDLSQCFLVHNGSSYPMYDTNKKEKNEKKASKVNTDAGYISVAPATGSKQNETFVCNLTSTGFYKTYGTTESRTEDFTDYEKRFLTVIDELVTESRKLDPRGKDYIGTVSRHLTEDESIDNIGASIAYAFLKDSKNADDWTTVTLTTWVSDVIFAPYYIKLPKELNKKEKRGFGVKETAPAVIHVKADTPFEFDTDKSPLIVCDWEGNFKKGTFQLNTTRVSKKKNNLLLTLLLAPVTYGASAFFVKYSEDFYKSVINFDGAKADWYNLEYSDKQPLVEDD